MQNNYRLLIANVKTLSPIYNHVFRVFLQTVIAVQHKFVSMIIYLITTPNPYFVSFQFQLVGPTLGRQYLECINFSSTAV